jgi:sulfur carrier protein ThiS
MRVTVNIKGVTGLPSGSKDIELKAAESAVEDLLQALLAERAGAQDGTNSGVPTNLIVTHNGQYVPVSRYRTQLLAAGDEVNIIPLVVGG